MKKVIVSLSIIIVLLFSQYLLYAQAKLDSLKNIDDYYIDFSVPDIGAFTLLGTKPDNITNPGNTKNLLPAF